jgi:hypothetical protein
VAPTGGTTLRCNIREEKLGGANERANGLGVGAMRRRLGGVRPAWVGRHEAGHDGGGVAT